MNSLICQAIRSRRLLMFGYGNAVRVVEPHLYGVNTAGNEALSAWLRPGLSRADPAGGWRMYLADDLRSMQALPEIFRGPRDGYNPHDPHFTEVYCRLEEPSVEVAPESDQPLADPGERPEDDEA